jgi:hypothetical protein
MPHTFRRGLPWGKASALDSAGINGREAVNVKESYRKGVANDSALDPREGVGNGTLEALGRGTRRSRSGPRQDVKTLLPSAAPNWRIGRRKEKAMSHKTHVNSNRESHSGMVPPKRSNESQGAPKETVAVNQGERQSGRYPYRTPSRTSGRTRAA